MAARWCFFVAVAFALCCYAGEGTVGPGTGVLEGSRSLASMADWYTAKSMGDISARGATINVSTTWPSYLCKGYYNPRRDSSAYLHGITSQGDTVKFSVATESASGKLPVIAKIITATSTDSIILFFQKRGN